MLGETFGMTPAQVDELDIRDLVAMQVAAYRRRREAWHHTAILWATAVNSGFRAPAVPVSPQDILNKVFARRTVTKAWLAEMRASHLERVERDRIRKRRRRRLMHG